MSLEQLTGDRGRQGRGHRLAGRLGGHPERHHGPRREAVRLGQQAEDDVLGEDLLVPVLDRQLARRDLRPLDAVEAYRWLFQPKYL
jgi:hypothetical protein